MMFVAPAMPRLRADVYAKEELNRCERVFDRFRPRGKAIGAFRRF
jgi:hypothetical protein